MLWYFRNLLVRCMARQHRAGVASVLALATLRGQTSAQVPTKQQKIKKIIYIYIYDKKFKNEIRLLEVRLLQ